MTLVLCGRDIEALERVRSEFLAESSVGCIHVVRMDLAELQSVRAAAEEVSTVVDRLDVLLCNAGATMMPESTTVDGFEYHFAVNYLSHFLLFNSVNSLMLATAKQNTVTTRVVLVSSAGHRYSPVLFEQDFHPEPFDPTIAYGSSKTALIYTAREIQRRFGDQGVRAFAVHPGGVKNAVYERLDPGVVAFMMEKYWSRMKSPAQGAATSVWAAVSPSADDFAGQYLEDCWRAEPVKGELDDLSPGYAPWAYDDEAAKKLWDVSLDLVARKDA